MSELYVLPSAMTINQTLWLRRQKTNSMNLAKNKDAIVSIQALMESIGVEN